MNEYILELSNTIRKLYESIYSIIQEYDCLIKTIDKQDLKLLSETYSSLTLPQIKFFLLSKFEARCTHYCILIKQVEPFFTKIFTNIDVINGTNLKEQYVLLCKLWLGDYYEDQENMYGMKALENFTKDIEREKKDICKAVFRDLVT